MGRPREARQLAVMARLGESLRGRRVLVTQARDFMGPALVEGFQEHGAEVFTGDEPLSEPGAAEKLVRSAGDVDVLIANLSFPAPATPAAEVGDDEWRAVFAHIVDPLPRLVRAVLPQMTARGSGKVVVMGSAAALRGMRNSSTYSAQPVARKSPMCERLVPKSPGLVSRST